MAPDAKFGMVSAPPVSARGTESSCTIRVSTRGPGSLERTSAA